VSRLTWLQARVDGPGTVSLTARISSRLSKTRPPMQHSGSTISLAPAAAAWRASAQLLARLASFSPCRTSNWMAAIFPVGVMDLLSSMHGRERRFVFGGAQVGPLDIGVVHDLARRSFLELAAGFQHH